ncbi:MAG: hypothetical protein R3C03_14460 [Pirellulaceae bacterium]
MESIVEVGFFFGRSNPVDHFSIGGIGGDDIDAAEDAIPLRGDDRVGKRLSLFKCPLMLGEVLAILLQRKFVTWPIPAE